MQHGRSCSDGCGVGGSDSGGSARPPIGLDMTNAEFAERARQWLKAITEENICLVAVPKQTLKEYYQPDEPHAMPKRKLCGDERKGMTSTHAAGNEDTCNTMPPHVRRSETQLFPNSYELVVSWLCGLWRDETGSKYEVMQVQGCDGLIRP